ncbi:Metallo-dependent phosphatase-like protein [Cunninghamella echinulata]|nr:Metallo-dependent phosphatase-like protein [Cunninghamella echinulata]
MFVTNDIEKVIPKQPGTVRFVCMSDTHGKTQFKFPIPDGDVFIHAGDLTRAGNYGEFKATIEWIKSLPHKIKIVTAGNHDHYLDERLTNSTNVKQELLALFEEAEITYLEHESYQLPDEFGGYRLFVSPYSPLHLGGAFMPIKGLRGRWDDVPDNIDIIVTHTPPRGTLDLTRRGQNVGCEFLEKRIYEINPKVSIFGHIHEAGGYEYHDNILFINACTSNYRYQPNQTPIVFDL